MAPTLTALEIFRAENDDFCKTHPQSPLTPEQKKNFTGLQYFPENPDLHLQLQVERFAQPETVAFQTSRGDTRHLSRYGKLKFTVEGQPVELTLYSSEHGYFLPFVDSLANTETYGGGRYLDPEPTPDGQVLIDFNYAYNPNCAYNPNWSCLLTPFENRLKVPIRAGEKIFPDAIH
jgi:uncharacterized protein